MAFHTYILACHSNTAIHIGATGELAEAVARHRRGLGGAYTAKYRIRKLVYYEEHETLAEALARERQLERWRRDWKAALIAARNPGWADLSLDPAFLRAHPLCVTRSRT